MRVVAVLKRKHSNRITYTPPFQSRVPCNIATLMDMGMGMAIGMAMGMIVAMDMDMFVGMVMIMGMAMSTIMVIMALN